MADNTIPENKLILASSSERRVTILKKFGVDFQCVPHKLEIEPAYSKNNNAYLGDFVKTLAVEKARSLEAVFPRNFILGSDTLISIGNKVLGKPSNFSEAFSMIQTLSGNIHSVYTGIGLINKTLGIIEADYDVTRVKIKSVTETQIFEYINRFQPFDKAGGYGIQDKDGIVESFEGSFENVLGLCTEKLMPMFDKIGIMQTAKN